MAQKHLCSTPGCTYPAWHAGNCAGEETDCLGRQRGVHLPELMHEIYAGSARAPSDSFPASLAFGQDYATLSFNATRKDFDAEHVLPHFVAVVRAELPHVDVGRMLESCRTLTTVAINGATVVGGACCTMVEVMTGSTRVNVLMVQVLAVARAHQRNGCGSQLVAQMLCELRKQCGSNSFGVMTVQGDNHAVDFWQKQGFKRSAHALELAEALHEWQTLYTGATSMLLELDHVPDTPCDAQRDRVTPAHAADSNASHGTGPAGGTPTDSVHPDQPIPNRKNKSGYKGVFVTRGKRWQGQFEHKSIGIFPTAWAAGVAVATKVARRDFRLCASHANVSEGADATRELWL